MPGAFVFATFDVAVRNWRCLFAPPFQAPHGPRALAAGVPEAPNARSLPRERLLVTRSTRTRAGAGRWTGTAPAGRPGSSECTSARSDRGRTKRCASHDLMSDPRHQGRTSRRSPYQCFIQALGSLSSAIGRRSARSSLAHPVFRFRTPHTVTGLVLTAARSHRHRSPPSRTASATAPPETLLPPPVAFAVCGLIAVCLQLPFRNRSRASRITSSPNANSAVWS